MKKYNALYYLLFILLVMGAFASMAQNSYGLKIMGGVAFIFGLVFVAELIAVLPKKDYYMMIETACLFFLSVIFGLRVYYIRFPYIEVLFATVAALLMLLYLRKMIRRFRFFQPKNNFLAILVIIFHGSIILFLCSLALVPFVPGLAEAAGVGAFILLLLFAAAALLKKNLMVLGENISAFGTVFRFKDHSVILVSLILLFSLYVGLNRIGVLPGIYSDEYPRAYFELVDKAASKQEKPVDGRYRHEEFMKQYQQFLDHNPVRN